MKRRDAIAAAVLAGLAVFIWWRDPAWAVDGRLPLITAVAFVVCWWLGRPWEPRAAALPANMLLVTGGVLLMVAGIVVGKTSALAFGWVLLLYAALTSRFARPDAALLRRLMFFPFLGFPWITMDLTSLGWWFRQSGAWAVGNMASLMGFEVVRSEGVNLLIQGQPIVVDAACAGMNVLEAMLVAGGFLVFSVFERSPLYWPNIILLPLMAWVANTLRILCISLVGVWFGAETAMGVFHNLGGWLVLIIMFVLAATVLLGERWLWDRWHRSAA